MLSDRVDSCGVVEASVDCCETSPDEVVNLVVCGSNSVVGSAIEGNFVVLTDVSSVAVGFITVELIAFSSVFGSFVVVVGSCVVGSCVVSSCIVGSFVVASCVGGSCVVASCVIGSCVVVSCVVGSCVVASCIVGSCVVASCVVGS